MGINDGVDERKMKISNYQNIACGAKAMIPQKMKENKETVQKYSKKIIDFVLDGFKHLNEIPEGESYQL
jgi:regulator of sigma D